MRPRARIDKAIAGIGSRLSAGYQKKVRSRGSTTNILTDTKGAFLRYT
jgi:hypothetical protein